MVDLTLLRHKETQDMGQRRIHMNPGEAQLGMTSPTSRILPFTPSLYVISPMFVLVIFQHREQICSKPYICILMHTKVHFAVLCEQHTYSRSLSFTKIFIKILIKRGHQAFGNMLILIGVNGSDLSC